MDTRRALQEAPEPAVLSVAFNEKRTRFVCGLDNGIRAFRSQDCLRTIKEAPETGPGIAIAALLDDRYLALVAGGRNLKTSPNKLEFWDNVEAKKTHELDFSEQILGVRMTSKVLAVVLKERTVCFSYATLKTGLRAPASIHGLYDTASNPYALCVIRRDTMVLPGLTPGQVQIIHLSDKTNKIVRAHAAELRQLDLSMDGEVLATASKTGTLIRVFWTSNLSQTHEFRRGVDHADIFSLSISPTNDFVAATSDKGTLHIFDLRPPRDPDATTIARKRSSLSRASTTSRPRPGSVDFDAMSLPSASSSPRTAGGFYGPPPDLSHVPPKTAPSALAALAKFPGMPRAFSDVRSMTSIPYHLGSDPPNWQGQAPYITTTLPNGHKGRVKNANVAVPGLPDGGPPKGVLAWDPEGGDRRLWIVGGGADAQWEVFELVEVGEEGSRLRVVRTGYRRYLTRQFADESG